MSDLPEMTPEEERYWDSMMKPAKPFDFSVPPSVLNRGPYSMPEPDRRAAKKSDAINPDYYKDAIETVDFMRANAKSHDHFLEFARLTALGYISRAGKKPGNPIAQEVGKAMWWLQWLAGKDPRK